MKFVISREALLKPLNLRILIEPGRFICGNAGILVTRVEYVKRTGTKNFVIVDAVGVCHQDMTDSRPMDQKKSVPLDKLLQAVALHRGDQLAE